MVADFVHDYNTPAFPVVIYFGERIDIDGETGELKLGL